MARGQHIARQMHEAHTGQHGQPAFPAQQFRRQRLAEKPFSLAGLAIHGPQQATQAGLVPCRAFAFVLLQLLQGIRRVRIFLLLFLHPALEHLQQLRAVFLQKAEGVFAQRRTGRHSRRQQRGMPVYHGILLSQSGSYPPQDLATAW